MRTVFVLFFGGIFAGTLCAISPPNLTCHYFYGGSSFEVPLAPQSTPYSPKQVPIGSRFEASAAYFKAAAGAHLKLSMRYLSDEGWQILHIAEFSGLEGLKKGQKFTGLQKIYEPATFAEIQYWCEARENTP